MQNSNLFMFLETYNYYVSSVKNALALAEKSTDKTIKNHYARQIDEGINKSEYFNNLLKGCKILKKHGISFYFDFINDEILVDEVFTKNGKTFVQSQPLKVKNNQLYIDDLTIFQWLGY